MSNLEYQLLKQEFYDLIDLAKEAPAGNDIFAECMYTAGFLLGKNIAYGNSALEPSRIFSKASTLEQLYVRIDDKLNRFIKGSDYPGDNDIDDLLGYLVLLKIALRRQNGTQETNESALQVD